MADEQLEFGVIVDYDPGPLTRARQDAANTVAAFNDLRTQLSAAGRATSQYGSQFNNAAKAVRDSTKATKLASDDLRILTRATLNQLDAVRQRAIAEQEAAIAQRQQFEAQRRGRTEAEKQLSAVRKVTAIEERRKVALLALAEAQNRGITLTAAEAKSLGGLSAAQIEAIASQEKLARAQAAKGDTNLRRINAETAALQAQNRLLDEQARKRAFADVGLTPEGRPIAEQQAKEQERINKQITEANFRRFKAENAEQIRLLKEKAQLEKQLTDPILAKRKAEVAILRERLALIEKAALAEARVAAGLAPPGGPGGPGGRGRGRGGPSPAERNERFNRSLNRTQSLANRISFTFRRLFGILAAFTIARNLVRAFNDSIRSAIEFNARLEQAQLGIASLFLAAGRVTNALGESVDGAQGLAIAQGEARRQTELLRVEALRTASTFEQLLENFQTAIGPGLQAGLGLDEIRKITVRLSQAAATLGVPQRQLAEEIRSLLQGTIRVRDTRIAVALGITNPDIRRAKELGNLAGFLEERFSAFATAGEEVEKTFTVLLTNTRDALVQLAGAVGEGFFEELKDLFEDVKDSILTLNKETRELEFNEEAIESATIFFDILKNSVQQARALGSSLDADAFQEIGVAVGRGLDVAFNALRVAIDVFVQGIQLAIQSLNVIFSTLNDIADIFRALIPERVRRDFGVILQRILAIGVASKAVAVVFKTLFSLVRGVAILVPGLVFSFKALGRAAKAVSLSIGAVLPGAALLATRFEKLTTVLKTGLVTILGWGAAILAATLYIKNFYLELVKSDNIVKNIQDKWKEVNKTLDNVNTPFGDAGTQEEADKVNELLNSIKLLEAELEDLSTENIFKRALEASIEDVKEGVEDIISAVASAADKALGDDTFTSTETRAKAIADLFSTTPGAITAATRGLQDQQDFLTDIRQLLLEINAQYEITKDTLGASGSIYEQRLQFAEAELEIEERTRQLVAARTQSENSIAQALADEKLLKDQILRTDREQQVIAFEALRKIKQEAKFRREIQDFEKEIFFIKEQQRKDEAAGREEDARKAAAAIAEINQQIDDRTTAINKEREALRSLAESEAFADLPDTEFQKLLDLAEKIAIAQATVAGNTENIREIDKDIAELENLILERASRRASIIAVQETREAKLKTAELERQADIEERLLRARSIFSVKPRAEALALAQEDLNIEEQRLALLQEEQKVTLSNLDKSIEAAEGTAAEKDLLDQKLATQRRFNAELAVQNVRLAQARQTIEELTLQQEEPFLTGIKTAFADFATTSLDTFTQTVNIMRNIFEGFVNFAADSLTSIFDPQNTQTAKERLGRFLLEIANQIIAMLIRIAVVKSLLGLDLLFGGKVTGSEASAATGNLGHGIITGGFKGGLIPKASDKRSHFGAHAQSLYKGGRPKGLHPKDTVPIWAMPGEWMMRATAVRKYGLAVMDRLNRGLVDPLALQALSGAKKVATSMSTPKTPSFQSGGLISERIGQAQEKSQTPEREQQLPIGMVLASEEQMDMLIHGGGAALDRYIQKNAASIRAYLNI